MSTVTSRIDDQAGQPVAVITINNPPVNAMSLAVRLELRDAVQAATADAQVVAMVLIGAGDKFIPGADIREFGQPPTGAQPPISGRDVIAAIEASTKPVVAALGGNALGGGLEIALGCHFRVARADCKLGLPEVNLGLLPGAGGTQRLPRLVGPARALELITSGKHFSAQQALADGVVDALVDPESPGGQYAEGQLLASALAFARRAVAEGQPLARVSQRNQRLAEATPALFTEFLAKHARKWRGLMAPQHIVRCIEAACLLPFDEAYAIELAAFNVCKASAQRGALIHLFNAEREVARIPGLSADLRPQRIRSAAVVGAGTMGGGIAMCFANAGIPVWLLDATPEALARGRALIEKNYATSVARGSLSQDQVDRALSLIAGTLAYGAIADTDIVIEAAFEDLAVKQGIFRQLDAVMKPGAVLATNTSTLNIDKIAEATTRPGSVVGAHFFSPANVMKLLEVVRTDGTAPQTLVTTMALAKQINKVAVLSGNADGFIGNRILAVYGRECDFLLEEGATPWQVDRALQGFGFPMGLYLMRDMSGLDVGWRIRQYREQFRDKRLRYSPIADRLCEQGRFGQKTGRGYYLYQGRDATPDPEVETLIAGVAAELKITRRAVSDDEIVTRVLSAMANEGLKIVGEGIALRAGDIDVAYVHGYGFPRHQGGPMYWAAQRGWPALLDTVQTYHASQGPLWAPAPRLLELARG
ncbi:3-hydroxyacyl-CoA dehydrogenase NAD-binding domain-containing protein [Aquabacterium sp.]|uniref:3-hydroxyacyl-CoA dehydrogenase NAD-binding domain-containing protein n=1 Tax=Aquabacterium sp. TaxID=1872578 RepID=UPI002C686E06|nr:3-hydroxyacyl-CoA dehydrogenase NAD-binding domain-containing protein [Aquabacterium sp.]HSW04921.1 3-hydroxyacyl-CoA dehydrogenase NAD-binding domain-containing protein [Aquabacterium sp.]